MRISKTHLCLSAAATAALISGCAPTTPAFDRHFGETVPALRAQQILDPNAPVANQGRNVEGIDGRSAREAVERYHQSFAEPPVQPNVFTIGVGSGGDNVSR